MESDGPMMAMDRFTVELNGREVDCWTANEGSPLSVGRVSPILELIRGENEIVWSITRPYRPGGSYMSGPHVNFKVSLTTVANYKTLIVFDETELEYKTVGTNLPPRMHPTLIGFSIGLLIMSIMIFHFRRRILFTLASCKQTIYRRTRKDSPKFSTL